MALRERGRVKRIVASGGGTLVAPSHEAFRITDIFCVPSASDTYLTLIIAGATIGKFRVKGCAGNCLPYPCVQTAQAYEAQLGTIFGWARERGFDLSIPLAAGQTLTITRYAEAGEVTILYDAYDPGDVAATEPNGSDATVRRYLHYMTNAAAVTTTPWPLDKSLIWTGMESWPVAARAVPANRSIRLFGVLGAPCAAGDASANKGATTYLSLLRQGNVLFDDEQDGLPFVGDVSSVAAAVTYKPIASVIGPLTAEYPYPPFWLPEPLALVAGETLTCQVVLTGAAATGIAAGELDVALALELTTG